MTLLKKSRSKPFYKQFIKLRQKIQNTKKLLTFTKQKWDNYLQFIKRTLRFFKRFKLRNQVGHVAILEATNKWTSYQRGRFRQILHTYKRFKIFYGGFSEKKIKKHIRQALAKNDSKKLKIKFLKLFESKLDVVLFRAKFSTSVKSARQLIAHGKIKVNNNRVKSQGYLLKSGDLISIDYKYKKLIERGPVTSRSRVWPTPPKHLIINYKTLQIIFGTIHNIHFAQFFSFNLNLDKLLFNYLRQ